MILRKTLADICDAGIEGPRGIENSGRRQKPVNGWRNGKFNGATSTRYRKDVEQLTTVAPSFDGIFAVPDHLENGAPRPHWVNSPANGNARVGNNASKRESVRIGGISAKSVWYE